MVKIRIELSGARSECLEAGQSVRMIGTVVWDVEDARLVTQKIFRLFIKDDYI